MTSWSEFEATEPRLAAKIRERFDARVHKTIATLRADGSPRISGTESKFAGGELWIGSMLRARKALDLLRDPRYALHSGSEDPPGWSGDAKVSGQVEAVTEEGAIAEVYGEDAPDGGNFHLFRLGIEVASHVGLDAERKALEVEVWTPERGLRTMRRD